MSTGARGAPAADLQPAPAAGPPGAFRRLPGRGDPL